MRVLDWRCHIRVAFTKGKNGEVTSLTLTEVDTIAEEAFMGALLHFLKNTDKPSACVIHQPWDGGRMLSYHTPSKQEYIDCCDRGKPT